jgi:glycosyltransferase involved in cell wall biosynthesis
MKNAKILMLGTDVSTMGGIASVVQDYIDSGLMDRLGIKYIATHRDGSKLSKVWFFLRQFPKAAAKSLASNLVHIHTSHGWSFRRLSSLLYFANLANRKTVLHVHGSQFDSYYDEAGKMERAWIRRGLRSANVVIALSEAWKEKLLAMEPMANVVVLRNGVNFAKYHVEESRSIHSPVNVLFLGRLGERKGIYDLLESINHLDISRFNFVLAGDGEIEQVREIVLKRGWQERVSVPGWVGPDEKEDLLRKADIYLLPSYHEGLPISILEAMAAALPIIATPVGGIPEAVIDGLNGYLIPPGDAVKIASRIETIAFDRSKWKAMSDASSNRALTKFDMQVVESRLKAVYDPLLA